VTVAVGLGLHLLDDFLGFLIGNLSKDDVLAIKMGSLDEGDEELRAVGVAAGVGHGEEVWAVMSRARR